jgi:hypothetical protein
MEAEVSQLIGAELGGRAPDRATLAPVLGRDSAGPTVNRE